MTWRPAGPGLGRGRGVVEAVQVEVNLQVNLHVNLQVNPLIILMGGVWNVMGGACTVMGGVRNVMGVGSIGHVSSGVCVVRVMCSCSVVVEAFQVCHGPMADWSRRALDPRAWGLGIDDPKRPKVRSGSGLGGRHIPRPDWWSDIVSDQIGCRT